MPNLAQFGSVVCLSLVFAVNGEIANAGFSSVCVADASGSSLLVMVKDKKSKKKNHDQNSGLSECTILGSGGGGGCKSGFNWKCEKLKSGKKCCGCVADKNAKPAQAPSPSGQDAENKGGTVLLPYFECDLSDPNKSCTQPKP